MDHGYPNKQCPCGCGMCFQHNPEWEKIEESLEPYRPSFWQRIDDSFHLSPPIKKCCGQRMGMYRMKKVLRCKKCGRIKEEYDEINYRAVCDCCGYHYTVEWSCGFYG